MNNNNATQRDYRPRYEELEKAKAAAGLVAGQCGCASGPFNAPQATMTPRNREIPEKFDVLFSRTDELSEKVGRLTNRLSPVLVIRPPCETKTCGEPAATEVGGMLAQLSVRLATIIEAVDNIDATLEL